MLAMRRFQMMIEPELYEALARRAAQEGEGTSVASLLRRFARERLEQANRGEDPLLEGLYEGPLRHADEPLDTTVYER
jgi:hypothetical protein